MQQRLSGKEAIPQFTGDQLVGKFPPKDFPTDCKLQPAPIRWMQNFGSNSQKAQIFFAQQQLTECQPGDKRFD